MDRIEVPPSVRSPLIFENRDGVIQASVVREALCGHEVEAIRMLFREDGSSPSSLRYHILCGLYVWVLARFIQ